MLKKKILIVTERRADYSKFRPIIKEIEQSAKLDYFLIVTGSHLLKEYGQTIRDIEKDGFKITAKFQMYAKQKGDTGREMVSALGKSIVHLSKFVEQLKPDIILSGFDIGANFAAAIVGAHMNKVVVHIEGGEVSGTIDDPIRHATTRFAHIHCVTNSTAATRLVRMGENPKNVYVTGAPGLDEICKIKLFDRDTLIKKYGLENGKDFVLFLFHPDGTNYDSLKEKTLIIIEAILEKKFQLIAFYPNSDSGGLAISEALKTYENKITLVIHAEREEFLSLVSESIVLIGNSSCGIIEAASLGTLVINLGQRQFLRERSSNVTDISIKENEIKDALEKIECSKKQSFKNIYGDGKASERIVKLLSNIDLSSKSTSKINVY